LCGAGGFDGKLISVQKLQEGGLRDPGADLPASWNDDAPGESDE